MIGLRSLIRNQSATASNEWKTSAPKVTLQSRIWRSGADLAVCPTGTVATFIAMGGPQGHADSFEDALRLDVDTNVDAADMNVRATVGGCRRSTVLLRMAGWQVGKDRVQRIWRREGVKNPAEQKPGARLNRALRLPVRRLTKSTTCNPPA